MRSAAVAPAPRASALRLLARGLLLPLVAGGACVFGFAPFYAWPVPMLAMLALLLVWRESGSPLQAALSGFAFGLGYFLAGVSWVFVSLHTFGGMPAALAASATFLFCAYLAVFPAAAGWIAARFTATGSHRRSAMAAAAFVATEWLRGTLFSGFSWLTLGNSQAPSGPFASLAPWIGAYGVSAAVMATAALVATCLGPRRRLRTGLAGLVVVAVACVTAPMVEWTQPAGSPVSVALLQGNVAQEMKWREEVRTRTLEDYRRMIFAAAARVVIIPETALPAFLDQLPPDYLASLRQHARESGKEILIGTVEREFRGEEFRYYNSLVSITGDRPQAYRKRHLVPFGEFIPPGFRWILAILHIPLSDFARGADAQPPITAGGIPFGVAICYEDIFGEEVIDALPAAQVLVNVSNDAWFGESFAADQHLQASQMRALETGRWMVRSTNTGASAAIDERGRVIKRLPPFASGTLVEQVTPRIGMTPYARTGNWPVLAMLLLVAMLAGRRPGK